MLLFFALACAAADEPLFTTDVTDDAVLARTVKEHYTKHDIKIPMRDGAKLYTVLYVPKDNTRTYPVILMRTPYSVSFYGEDNYPTATSRSLRRMFANAALLRSGYIYAFQDVRGRFMSEGEFVDVRPLGSKVDEATDTFDTIEYLAKHAPKSNGKVGITGISYPGFYAAVGAVSLHPALKAVSPQAPVTEWFLGDDFHHNGALFLRDAHNFYRVFGRKRTALTAKWEEVPELEMADEYDFFLRMGPLENAGLAHIGFWNDLMAHPTRDAFWQARDPRPHYKGIKAAVMTVGGWFDAEDVWGTLATYRAFEAQNPGIENTVVLGPWRHGGWHRMDGSELGDVSFAAKTSVFYKEQIEAPFFERHLKGKKGLPTEAYVFETGANEWHAYEKWPPSGTTQRVLNLHADGTLSTAKATPGERSYLADPSKPVPHIGTIGAGTKEEYMNADQRFAARRPDVLVYETKPLPAEVVLAGPIEVSLDVKSTGTDADFIVKLVDVYASDMTAPDPNPKDIRYAGYQQLVRAEVMRARFRKSFTAPEALVPGEVTRISFTLTDVHHRFALGHRLMVQVQSSWFPLVERNPQSFVDLAKAKASDFKSATQTVLSTSSLKVGVMRGELP